MAAVLRVLVLCSVCHRCIGLACLCIFDVDRTLTGRQDHPSDAAAQCPGTRHISADHDWAYCGGELVLSALAVNLNSTFCAGCFLGVVSTGKQLEKPPPTLGQLNSALLGKPESWDFGCPTGGLTTSPFIMGCRDGQKQHTVPSIVNWYRAHGVSISDEEVYFFDDRPDNVEPFRGTTYNAQQVSCGSRDPDPFDDSLLWCSNCPNRAQGTVGYCGGKPSEVVRRRGVHLCPSESALSDEEERAISQCVATSVFQAWRPLILLQLLGEGWTLAILLMLLGALAPLRLCCRKRSSAGREYVEYTKLDSGL